MGAAGGGLTMPQIIDVMEELAQMLRDGGLTRPVTTDPRNLTPPCVLVEPPDMSPGGVLCSGVQFTFRVLVLGLPGARAELKALARLLDEVIEALGGRYDLAEPVSYVPLQSTAAAEPIQAYRITMGVTQ